VAAFFFFFFGEGVEAEVVAEVEAEVEAEVVVLWGGESSSGTSSALRADRVLLVEKCRDVAADVVDFFGIGAGSDWGGVATNAKGRRD